MRINRTRSIIFVATSWKQHRSARKLADQLTYRDENTIRSAPETFKGQERVVIRRKKTTGVDGGTRREVSCFAIGKTGRRIASGTRGARRSADFLGRNLISRPKFSKTREVSSIQRDVTLAIQSFCCGENYVILLERGIERDWQYDNNNDPLSVRYRRIQQEQ